ncbi:MAG: acetylxylan esterase [Opitutus sp.]
MSIVPLGFRAAVWLLGGFASVFGLGVAQAQTPITPVPPQANLRVAAIQVRVKPDHRDWTYQLGETPRFTIAVTADNEPVDNASVSFVISPDMMPGERKTAKVPLDGLVVEGGSMTEPGFLRCNASVEIAGRTYRGAATAAFAPEKILPLQTEPDDFDAFWKAQLAQLNQVPMASQLTYLPEASSDTLNVYHVSFATANGPEKTAAPARIFGILCEPKAPGKYPAILKVPGAHARSYSGEKVLADHGAITLEIGIEGIPVNLPKEVYDTLDVGALNSYWFFNLDDREAYYYRRVFLGCVRANDFLVARPNWDGKNLVVMGASQGGQLAIATAALDRRVTAVSATHPAFCDVAAELHGRAGGFPHPFRPDASGKPSPHATPAKIATATYYDTVNFARRLKVPGYYTWGYNDDVCPPTSTYAAYNVITAPKTLGVTLELAHSYNQEQGAAINAWILNFLGLK